MILSAQLVRSFWGEQGNREIILTTLLKVMLFIG